MSYDWQVDAEACGQLLHNRQKLWYTVAADACNIQDEIMAVDPGLDPHVYRNRTGYYVEFKKRCSNKMLPCRWHRHSEEQAQRVEARKEAARIKALTGRLASMSVIDLARSTETRPHLLAVANALDPQSDTPQVDPRFGDNPVLRS